MAKPTLARGMRDFLPKQVYERQYIFNIIRTTFEKYGFQPIETPVIENLSILSEKYGEEGDKLLFKVLNSGEYLSDVNQDDLSAKNHSAITSKITEKGLRYDLTVPLARYVVMHRNDIVIPFKRYHIDKVWRADRPQKGRYREFYQCDADCIGSPSLLYDAECILLFDDALNQLNVPDFIIKVNNRKILAGIAEAWDFTDQFKDFVIAIDKWDKIGEDGVIRELGNKGFSEAKIHAIQQLFRVTGSNSEKLETLKTLLLNSPTGNKGIEELEKVLDYLSGTPLNKGIIELDFSLARGLDYYTSTIFEVVLKNYAMGSIASGGRYDELTAGFGMSDMPGVGISFGAERIYDVLADLNLLPEMAASSVKVLLVNFGGEEEKFAFSLLQKLHTENISSELYPADSKIGKQFQYAEKKGIPYVITAGADEIRDHVYQLKNIINGEQEKLNLESLIAKLKS